MTYQQLDLIADSFIPCLFVITLMRMVKMAYDKSFTVLMTDLSAVFLSVVLVYCYMFIDNAFHIWPSFNADYSTHTALALAFVCLFVFKSKLERKLVITSMSLYGLLMLYQEYHTVLDILSTTLFLLPQFVLVHIKIKRDQVKVA